jgi:hypothetical protein
MKKRKFRIQKDSKHGLVQVELKGLDPPNITRFCCPDSDGRTLWEFLNDLPDKAILKIHMETGLVQ